MPKLALSWRTTLTPGGGREVSIQTAGIPAGGTTGSPSMYPPTKPDGWSVTNTSSMRFASSGPAMGSTMAKHHPRRRPSRMSER